jgi:flagellin
MFDILLLEMERQLIWTSNLHIHMCDFAHITPPNGGTTLVYDDRTKPNKLVNAIIGRTMNFVSLPKWFKEGTAGFIYSRDERVLDDGGTAD